MKKFDDVLEFIDMFAITPQVMAWKKRKISSRLSQFLSILLLVYFSISIIYALVAYFNQDGYILIQKKELRDKSKDLMFKSDMSNFGFKFQNQTLQQQADSYFIFEYQQFQVDIKSGQLIQSEKQQMQRCNKSDFSQISDEDLIDQSFCIPKDQDIFLINNSTTISYFQMYISFCQTSDCQIIDETAKTQFLSQFGEKPQIIDIYFQNKMINLQDQNYVQFNLDSFQHQFSIKNNNQLRQIDIKVQQFEIDVDQRQYHYLQQKKSISGVQINADKIISYNIEQENNTSLMFALKLMPDIYIDKQIIILSNFGDLITEVLGQTLYVFCFFYLIGNYSNQNYFQILVAKKSLRIKLDLKLKHILMGYNLKSILNDDQISRLYKFLDIHSIIKDSLNGNIIKKTLFSRNTNQIFKILQDLPKSLNDLRNEYYDLKIKKENMIQAKKGEIYKKQNNDISQIGLNQSQIQLKEQNKEKDQKDEEEEEEEEENVEEKEVKKKEEEDKAEIEKMDLEQKKLQAFQEFLKSLNNINSKNVFKNFFDILVEVEFKKKLFKQYRFVFEYDVKDKYKRFQEMQNDQLKSDQTYFGIFGLK